MAAPEFKFADDRLDFRFYLSKKKFENERNLSLEMLGIANSLDLTDRLLPRLQLKPEHKPHLLRFSPYNRDQMMSIVNERSVENLYFHFVNVSSNL